MIYKTAIWWVRRDMRLHDNQALHKALTESEQVIPLYIFDENLKKLHKGAHARSTFMRHALRSLDNDLQEIGSKLVTRYGDPTEVLPTLTKECNVEAIYAQEDVVPFLRKRDEKVGKKVNLIVTSGLNILPLEDIKKTDNTPYTVFTPYKKAMLSKQMPTRKDLFQKPKKIVTPKVNSDGIEEYNDEIIDQYYSASEKAAREKLLNFSDKVIHSYTDSRNFPEIEGTSRLSAYFKFGLLSPREAVVIAVEAAENAKTNSERLGAETWLSELIWRDFYNTILYYFPRVLDASFKPKYDKIKWRNNKHEFKAWCEGRTGYPIVDAGMRQLNNTGWMHNRLRMITASFLIKHLLIDWRWGEKYFMEKLVDFDFAANNGGWQWTAGTGTDAAPYFRIFNPITQSQKFDPDGNFIKKWIPELKHYDSKQIHMPWQVPPIFQQSLDCRIGEDYPEPIVDHKAARERCLKAYKDVKS